jgi:hypothetical protein
MAYLWASAVAADTVCGSRFIGPCTAIVPCYEVEVEVNLRPTVSRPVCLGVGLPSGAHDQIIFFSV